MSERPPSPLVRRTRRAHRRVPFNDLIACGLLGFIFLALLSLQIFGPGSAVVIDPADVPATVQLDGVYPVEQSQSGAFRWTSPEAIILAELPIHGDYQVTLTVQDTPQNTTPRTLTVVLDGESVGTVALGNEPQTVTFRRTGLHRAWDKTVPPLQIVLQTQGYQAPGDARELGVVLRAAAVRTIIPPPAQGLRLALPGLLILWGVYGLLRACRLSAPVATLGVGSGGSALFLLLILQQPFLPLHFVTLLADRPSALAGIMLLLAALAGSALAWPMVAPRWMLGAVLAMPLALQLGALVWMIWVEPVQVPWYDELFDASYIWRAWERGLNWGDLWQFYAAHRIPTLRLVNFLTISATGWDRRVLLTLQMVATLLTFLALAGVLRRTLPTRAGQLAILAAIGALLFSLSQYGQWLLTYGLQFHLAILGLAGGLWLLSNQPTGWGRLTLAITGAWLASWSGLHGLIIWVVLLPLVWRSGWAKVAAWLGGATVVIATYVVGFPRASVRQFDLLGLATFTLTGLGAPLGTFQRVTARAQFWNHGEVTLDYRWALWIGAVGIALLAINMGVLATFRDRELLWRTVPWCSLALFAAICAALTGQGRGERPNIALTSRYQNFAVLWWAAIVVIIGLTLWRLWQEGTRQPWQRLVVGGNIAALLLGAGAFFEVNLTSTLVARDWHRTLRQAEACASDLGSAPDDCLMPLHPVPSVARLRLASLAAARLALYRDGSPPTGAASPTPPATAPDLASLRPLPFGALYAINGLPGPLASVDGVPPPPRFAAGQPLQLTGWAVDAIGIPPGAAGGVFLAIDNRPLTWVPTTRDCPEVAARFNLRPSRCGFLLELPTGMLAPGRHTVRITVVTGDRSAAYQQSAELTFYVE